MPQWKQYSGIWTVTQQAQAAAAETWPLRFDYELYAWGAGSKGRTAQNDVIDRSSPVQIGALTTWAQVSMGSGSDQAIAKKTDGTIWAWGDGGNGRLGQNNTINYSSPVQIGALTTWTQVSTGNGASGAIKTDGTLWLWGQGSFGRLGNNSTADLSSPDRS